MRKGTRVVAATLAGFVIMRISAALMEFAVALVVGLAAGVLVWLLTAPRQRTG